MPHSEFIHLHVHTQYSLLDGACQISPLLSLAAKYKMDSLAITDHGNMFGAIHFYLEAQKAGIKPIIGCETYIAPKSRLEKSASSINEASYHLLLLAKDEAGYHNLMKLVSIGYLEGFYYRPRIDKEVLAQHSEGLIGLTACLKGEIPSLLSQGQYNEALKKADELLNIFGRGNFYLEIQANGIPEQKKANDGLIKISKELGIPLAATNDVHYLAREHARAHEALLCIQTQNTLDNPERMRFQTDEFYFKSPEEMKKLFADNPEAIANTREIADRCNLELDFKKIHLPKYEPPGGKNKEDYLKDLCLEGLKKKYPSVNDAVNNRLEHELKVIKDMGFTSYFLIVWDFIHYAKSLHIPVGPGRGSAAGSIVSYLLDITSIDPLRYGLLFERFLNPERLSMPDIDIDFCYERRQEVINYVTQKYGQSNVAQIITFGTMQARAVVRDVGRVMSISYADVDRIAKMIPPDPNMTLKDALTSEPEVNKLYTTDPQIKDLIDTALSLEGLNRHASVHAAGVVIGDKPLNNYSPLFATQEEQITTGYDMFSLEKIGLLKVDFLGLRTLTVIDQTVKLILLTRGQMVDPEQFLLEDPKTYQLLCNAQSMGIFQLESSGMRDLLRKMQPECFEDLIALLALYRPGPMGSGMLDDFIQRKRNKAPIRYDHKQLEPILKDTYGIMVFQEQIMQIASALGGFSLAQADLLRRAMGKKIPEVMEKERSNFIKGCMHNGIKESIAGKIFDQIEFFSGYGFNRSHSAAYALISFRTAYLKANFPVEFMCALLTSERDNTDKIVEYVNESGHMGIEILPPDINESDALFKIVDGTNIRFGLLAVKNVGKGAVESIVESRKTSGRYKSLEDLCQRVDLRLANRKVLESLIKCGALDTLARNRAQMFASLEHILEYSSKAQRERSSGQISFFDAPPEGGNGFSPVVKNTVDIKEWPEPQLLAFEKEMIGFYISGHPLTRYARQLKRFTSSPIDVLPQQKDQDTVKLIGMITKIKHTVTRAKQEKMAILKLEDLTAIVEVLVFPKTFQKVSRYLHPNSVVMVKGRLNLKEEAPKILADDIFSIEEVYKLITGLTVNVSGIRDNLFTSLRTLLSAAPGSIPVFLHLDTPSKSRVQLLVGENLFVAPSEQLINGIEDLLGEEKLSLSL